MNNERMARRAKLHRESNWMVEFYNPAMRMTVETGWPSWSAAMARCAHYSRKYGAFDGFEKPRLIRGSAQGRVEAS